MISRRDAVKLGAATVFLRGNEVAASSAEQSVQLVPNNLGPSLASPIAIKWEARNASWSEIGSSLVGDTLVAANDNRISAISSVTGIEQWTFSIPEDDNYAYIYAPAITHNCVVFVSDHGQDLFMHSFDLASGDELWRFRLQFPSIPVFHDNIVFLLGSETGLTGLDVRSGDASWVAPEPIQALPVHVQTNRIFAWASGGYCAIEMESGAMIWDMHEVDTEPSIEWLPYPTLIDHDLYFSLDDHTIRCIDGMDGRVNWSFPAPDIFHPLVIIDDGLIGLCLDGNAYRLSKDTGEVVWRWGVIDSSWNLSGYDSWINPSDIPIGELFYPTSQDGLLIAIDTKTGVERWRQQYDYYRHRPTLSGDTVYIFESQSISCLNSLTGDLLWNHKFDELEYEFASHGHPLVHDGNIYLSGYPSVAIGNVHPPTLADTSELLAAPFEGALLRRTVDAGEVLDSIGMREVQEGVVWVEATKEEDTGWIRLDSIDPSTLPPEEGWEVIYQP